jgi:ABC-2 type transport system ATP-binding protein
VNREVVIQARGLTKRFGGFTAVDRADIEVVRGSIFGFLGPNGAGKSTAIRMLAGLLTPTAGEIRIEDIDVRKQPELAKRRIGYMTQHFSLYEEISLAQNLDFYGGIYGGSRERRAELVELLGLGRYLDRQASDVPGGVRQKLSLCCVLLHSPPVLFLDEPTAGVDPLSRRAFWDIISGLSHEGTTVFLTTHFLDEAEYCHDLGFIRDGRVMAGGSPQELRARFASTVLYEIRIADYAAAERHLARWEGVDETYLHGPRVHAFARPDVTVQDVAHRLGAGGFTATSIERIPPSMEDIFIALTTSDVAAAEAAG